MSNLETDPAELTCTNTSGDGAERGQVLNYREVPLGGPRAMRVRRTLPQRARSLIGAWCFVDHYGPDEVSETGGMRVAGHPHTGLQTVSWLFSGEIEHHDTTGVHASVRPGELNLMTAGSGIAHSEFSTPSTTVLHGVQLWVALPDADRFTAPGFEHYAPPPLDLDGARALVFLGSLAGHTAPVRTHTPLLGAEITLAPGRTLRLDTDRAFEHGVLVDTGEITVAHVTATDGQLVYRPAGADTITIESAPGRSSRVLLLGGRPLNERIVLWWNFIGRDHEEIAEFREQWQRERHGDGSTTRYGAFPPHWQDTLPAPALPHVQLKPRG